MEWQTIESKNEPNENLKNPIIKSNEYKLKGEQYSLKFTQCLYETTLGFDIPILLLNLWTNYFKDASKSLTDLNDVWLKLNEKENELLILSINSLATKLNEYEKLFDRYLIATKSFSMRNEKIKRSSQKQEDILKFIPINLHNEHFLVESHDYTGNMKNSCYDFVSVGAFTTMNIAKSILPRQTETLMNNSKSFEFNKQADSVRLVDTKHQPIFSENVLLFYSLKILIANLTDLKSVRITDDKIQIILRISENIEILTKCLIPGFLRNRVKRLELLKIPTNDFINKLTYLNVKFNELSNKVKQTDFENLDHFIFRIIDPLIEFYSIIFTEQFSEKLEFINICSNYSNALATLISSLDLRYYKNFKLNEADLKNNYDFHLKHGILFEIESILSCFSNESDMMFDHFSAIQELHNVFIHFPLDTNGSIKEAASSIIINLENNGYHVHFYSNFETVPIRVYPILFNVGINEQAISSNLFGNNLLQKMINSNSIMKLRKYYNNARDNIEDLELKNKVDTLMKRLETTRSFIDDSRPIELLHITAEISRLLGGLRVTNCKSGKDRTGVSISLEQCFILIRNHNLESNLTQYVLDDLRRNGTRLDVVRKNVGQKKYAFNKIRYFLLPQLYRPPIDLCDDLET